MGREPVEVAAAVERQPLAGARADADRDRQVGQRRARPAAQVDDDGGPAACAHERGAGDVDLRRCARRARSGSRAAIWRSALSFARALRSWVVTQPASSDGGADEHGRHGELGDGVSRTRH